MAGTIAGYLPMVGSERSVSTGRLVVALLGFAVLAFGVGAGVEAAELGRGTAIAGAIVLALVFVLVLLGGHVAAPAEPVAADRPDRSFARDRPREAYVLGVCGAAALALVLGGLLFLVLPGDLTALAVLLVGVVAWTTVVMASFRLRSRHRPYPGPRAERSWAVDLTYQRRVRAARSRAPDNQ
jgi:high-affinity Fe2+/Pb2+ permease